ncbi:hypothetical protein E2C01_082398 [Portunus trituberculatus]|uniref:Uncharacterized protein n=1 Tax=Portunus trituberculatus TaxID=210409 RepID=A0A5B7IZ53_PORTR|nr:hypothetical protein [Portunus trituberculatus]
MRGAAANAPGVDSRAGLAVWREWGQRHGSGGADAEDGAAEWVTVGMEFVAAEEQNKNEVLKCSSLEILEPDPTNACEMPGRILEL